MRSAQEILEEAKAKKIGKLHPDYVDDKARIHLPDLRTLLEAGAKIRSLNQEQASGFYLHQVEYGGHRFIALSKDPIGE